MKNALSLLQAVAQTAQEMKPGGQPSPGFSLRHAFFDLMQFVGYFLAIGAIGFRFGIVRRARGISEEARMILRADNAAVFGMIGVALLALSYLGAPYVEAVTHHKAFIEALPKKLAPFELKMGMLAIAMVGFASVRAAPSVGWSVAIAGILVAVLQPLYTGKLSGKVNAVHILAASTWLGTLLVLTVIGIRGVMGSMTAGIQRAQLTADLVNSFSPLALTASAIVVMTGLTTAWLHLKRVSSLWTTSYGIALLIKLALVVVVVTLGAWNWRRVRPALGGEGSEETIRRSATLELSFAALVLIATSVLVSLPSPK